MTDPAAKRPPATGGRALFLVCLYGVLGFGLEYVLSAALPLLVLERGGDAAVVGLLVAAYGIPTVVLRPILGRVIDTPLRPKVIRGAAAILGLAPLGYLIPALPAMLATRIVQGIGWSGYGTGGQVMLARVAHPARRGQASGYYQATPSLAILVGPSIGLWLYASVGAHGPFLLSAALGLAALALTRWLPIGPPPTPEAHVERRPVRLILGLFDRSAVVPMVLIATFMSVNSLFVIFAPVYARAHAIPIEQLALYYPAYGAVSLFGYLFLARTSDRIGRRRAIVIGCVGAIVGISLAALWPGLIGLAVGSGLYGIATAVVASSVSALTMERAAPGRMGSAMATYSVGYQLGLSVGGAAWGAILSVFGYPWPFVGGALMVAVALAITLAGLGPARPVRAAAAT